MTNELVISVTAEDIQQGMRHSSDRCPIALAVRRVIPDARVGLGGVWLGEVRTRHEPEYLYVTTDKMRLFIDMFDTGHPVQPARFRLRRVAT